MQIYASKAVCTWIPKNACSTLRFAVAHANGCVRDLSDINWIHDNNQTFNATTQTAFLADYTFTILRCPFSRLYSAYMDKIVDMNPISWVMWRNSNQENHPHQMTFRKFVQLNHKKLSIQHDIHWRRQTDFLLYDNYDDIFRLEDYQHIAETLKQKIGLELVDTREALGHGASQRVKSSEDQKPWAKTALELLILKSKGIVPAPELMFDAQMIEQVVHMYGTDLQLYEDLFGRSPLMKKFLK